MNLFPGPSALECHPIRWEQHESAGNCQINLLPASSALDFQPIRIEQNGSGCNCQVTLLPTQLRPVDPSYKLLLEYNLLLTQRLTIYPLALLGLF
jgi:hypothetical protein